MTTRAAAPPSEPTDVGGIGSAPVGGSLGWRLLSTVPTAIPLAVSAYGLVAMVLLLAGQFRAGLVLPLGGVAALVAVVASGLASAAAGLERKVCDLAALALSVGAAAVNVHYGSRDIQVRRDPGIYATTGVYLIHHASLVLRTNPVLFGSVHGVTFGANGYGSTTTRGVLFAQGMHLIPVLIATFGFAVGDYRALAATALLGAAGLLAVYGFARGLARPRYALLVTALLAGSLPELYVSRDTFTEAVDQLLIFGALGLVWLAQQRGRAVDAVLAGLAVGAGTMTRIDGYLNLDAFLVAGILLLAFTPSARRPHALRQGLLMAAAALPATVVSYLDVTRLSRGYYTSQRTSILPLLDLLAVLLVIGVIGVPLVWRLGLAVRVQRLAPRLWPRAAVAVVVVVAAGLASRPLWFTGHNGTGNVGNHLVAGLQAQAHVAIDPTRSYSEHTVTWMVWYLGLPAVLLGLVGLCVLVHRHARGRTPLVLPFTALLLTTSLLYLVSPHIVPDQVWAARRYVPVVFPGVLVCAAVTLDLLPPGRWAGVLGLAAIPVLLVPPALTTKPLARAAQYRSEAMETQRLCRALPAHSEVVYLDSFGGNDMPTERAFCGHPAAEFLHATPAGLAAVRAAALAHGLTLYGVSSSLADTGISTVSPPPTLDGILISSWALGLVRPPTTTSVGLQTVYLGPISAAGLLTG